MATSLIENYNSVFLWVEIAPVVLIAAGAGAAMQKYDRYASFITTFLNVNPMRPIGQ